MLAECRLQAMSTLLRRAAIQGLLAMQFLLSRPKRAGMVLACSWISGWIEFLAQLSKGLDRYSHDGHCPR